MTSLMNGIVTTILISIFFQKFVQADENECNYTTKIIVIFQMYIIEYLTIYEKRMIIF